MDPQGRVGFGIMMLHIEVFELRTEIGAGNKLLGLCRLPAVVMFGLPYSRSLDQSLLTTSHGWRASRLAGGLTIRRF